MPYLDHKDRDRLEAGNPMRGPGDFNYLVTLLVKRYARDMGESYQTYNDILGALEGAKLELYRRKISGYEDRKISENGDVY